MNNAENVLLPVITVENDLIKTCNELFLEQFGYTELELIGSRLQDILSIEDQVFETKSSLESLYIDASLNESGVYSAGKLKNKHHYVLLVKVYCQCDVGTVGTVGTFRLCFRVLTNKSIDPITNLPNGWAISSKCNYLLSQPEVTTFDLVLIIFLVDNFSTINFRHSYQIGDDYLVVLGKKLLQVVQEHGLVVRYSNAKFGILLENHQKLSSTAFRQYITQLCQTLCDLSAQPIELSNNIEVNKSFSIGVSELGGEYKSYFAMEVATETAMQRAEKYSTSKYFYATTQATDSLLFNNIVIDELPAAIEKHQIDINYQPQYDLNSGKLVALEALSRWHHQELGSISPDIFVGIAEDIGLHFEFDLSVFTRVCSQIVAWTQQGLNPPKMSINISFKTLEMTNFISRIEQIIAQTNCPTALIEIEITETTSVTNINVLIENIVKVKQLGIAIAVDDFGSGYSSLSLIRSLHLSLDKLKLDRSLIENMCNTTVDREFVRQIISLGDVLNVQVLAEGIEDARQYQLLQQLGCDFGQGYYFEQALSKHQTEQLIREKLPLT